MMGVNVPLPIFPDKKLGVNGVELKKEHKNLHIYLKMENITAVTNVNKIRKQNHHF